MSLAPTSGMVLAAGLGLRLRPLTEHMPKPLVPLRGRPRKQPWHGSRPVRRARRQLDAIGAP